MYQHDDTDNIEVNSLIHFNPRTRLLEENAYDYELQDVVEPNLFRKFFDYDNVPKTTFNNRHVPINPPEHMWITDTTFRDGQQSVSPFSVQQIADIFEMMHRLGGPNGIIRASEFFIYSEKDRAAVRKCQEFGFEFPEITAWIRANEKDFQLVKDMELQETGILVSCSDYHIFNKMGLTRKQALDKYLGIVKSALSHGIRPRCHFEDITRADFYGFVVPFAHALMRLADESGIPIKIRACDTMGYGLTYPGVSLPRSVQGIVYGLHMFAHVPHAWLEWHGHNDFYKVVTNAASAWLYGCSGVNCALMGIGERTVNCPLEAMAIEYASLRGTPNGMDFSVITEIADYFQYNLGIDIPARTPFVGSNFNVTRAGIHADGLLKDEEIYNIFNTKKILNRPAMVTVDSFSGLAGIAHWINGHFRLNEAQSIAKQDDLVAGIYDLVQKEYADGRNTSMSDAELEAMMEKIDADKYQQLMRIRHRL